LGSEDEGVEVDEGEDGGNGGGGGSLEKSEER